MDFDLKMAEQEAKEQYDIELAASEKLKSLNNTDAQNQKEAAEKASKDLLIEKQKQSDANIAFIAKDTLVELGLFTNHFVKYFSGL